MSAVQTAAARPLWHLFMPPLFVLLWASGFVVTKLGIAFAEPFTFLLYRFVIVTVLLAAIALATRAPWPRSWRLAGHIAVVGLLLQAMYLGGVYTAIARGIPAGISALIVGVQPIIIAAAVGPLLGERVRARQWLGLLLGFLGIGMVLWNKLSLDIGQLEGVAWNVVGLIGITAATLYQKRYCAGMDWRSGGVIQYAAAAVATYAMTLIMGESGAIVWSRDIVIAYLWLILVLSIGAVSLLGWLIRRGEASRVASMFYLVPPTAALGSWLLFGETLGALALLGMAVTVLGVALVARR
ncbi:MAG TPA: DMT family transporter [Candidatus Acidoferrum sp.]|nr:DMT family transporter [Candidatus Acidoferrum sp.]